MASKDSLAAALAEFYSKVGTIHEDAKAQYGSYADLSSVLAVVNPALANSGLAITQTFDDDADARFLVTTLHHTSGENERSRTKLVTEGGRGNPLHTWGGSVTYQRRYALLSMLNLAAGIEDSDGATAATAAPTPAQQQQPAKAAAPSQEDPLTKEQKDLIIGVLKECNAAYRDKVLAAFVKEFGASKAKVSDRIQAVKHNSFFQSYFSANPQ